MKQDHSQAGSRPRVAVCFSGFARNCTLTRSISSIWGVANYDAFIMSWRQHFELDVAPVVDGDALCRDLRSRGFRRCASSLLDYNPTSFYQATSDRCVLEKGRIATYPHRTASMLFGYARCMAAVREAQARSAVRYDWVVLTRLDVLDGVQPCGALHQKRGCMLSTNQAVSLLPSWEQLDQLHLLALRGPPGFRRIEDRLMVGRPSALAQLEHVFVNYTRDFLGPGKTHGSFVEQYLWLFLLRPPYSPRSKGLADTGTYFDLPVPTSKSVTQSTAIGFNPGRFSLCFFYRVMRALRLGGADLLEMVDRFASAPKEERCHEWVAQYARNSSVSCHSFDNKPTLNRLVPGLRAYDELHPESVSMSNFPAAAATPLSLQTTLDSVRWTDWVGRVPVAKRNF